MSLAAFLLLGGLLSGGATDGFRLSTLSTPSSPSSSAISTDPCSDGSWGDLAVNDGNVVHVNASRGSSTASGTQDDPYATLAQAVAAVEALNGNFPILLHAGTYDTGAGLTISNGNVRDYWVYGCPGETIITADSATTAIISQVDSLYLHGLAFTGAYKGVGAYYGSEVTITDSEFYSMDSGFGASMGNATINATNVSVTNMNQEGVYAVVDGYLNLTDVTIDSVHGSGVWLPYLGHLQADGLTITNMLKGSLDTGVGIYAEYYSSIDAIDVDINGAVGAGIYAETLLTISMDQVEVYNVVAEPTNGVGHGVIMADSNSAHQYIADVEITNLTVDGVDGAGFVMNNGVLNDFANISITNAGEVDSSTGLSAFVQNGTAVDSAISSSVYVSLSAADALDWKLR